MRYTITLPRESIHQENFRWPEQLSVIELDASRGSVQLELFQKLQQSEPLHEPEVLWLLSHILKPGDTFLDIGANIGHFTLPAAELVGSSGRVISIEAEEKNCQVLQQSLQEHNLNWIDAHQAVLGKEEKKAVFYINDDSAGGHALYDVSLLPQNTQSKQNRRRQLVKLQTFDSLAQQLNIQTLRAMKIDCEGAEFDILRGARQFLQHMRPPFIIAEIHAVGLELLGGNEIQLKQFMKELGYDCYGLSPNAAGFVPLETNRTYRYSYIYNALFTTPASLQEIGLVP